MPEKDAKAPDGRALVGDLYSFAAVLALVAVVSLVIGVHDAGLARSSLGVIVSSAMLLAVGVVLLVVVAQLVGMEQARPLGGGRASAVQADRPRRVPPV